MMPHLRTIVIAALLVGIAVSAPRAAALAAAVQGLGPRDALLATSSDGRVRLAHNPEKRLVPASTLKVVTALAARHYLGADFRFATDFFIDTEGRLTIRGYGDPLLVSEVLAAIARELRRRIPSRITAIRLDDAYFSKPLVIPGVSASTNPYDAPNGALCVNFNTVNFKTAGGRFESAEPQTPLLPMVLKRIRASGLSRGRIVLARHGDEAVRYAGHLFRHFLRDAGLKVEGPIELTPRAPAPGERIYRHTSPFSLDELTARLMEYSNNFIANQLLIAAGARQYGPPGNLTKGARALDAYVREVLGVADARLVEGSGISRENRVSAQALMAALVRFEPHRHLMPQADGVAFKTGTLKGIRTRVGYIETETGLCRFVLLLNTPGKRPEPILQRVRTLLQTP